MTVEQYGIRQQELPQAFATEPVMGKQFGFLFSIYSMAPSPMAYDCSSHGVSSLMLIVFGTSPNPTGTGTGNGTVSNARHTANRKGTAV